ncbi:MAG: choice-of-anchor Q domain-containing protein [Luteolibacter sp.]
MIPPFHHLLAALLLLPLAAHGTTVTTTTDEDDGSLDGGTGVSLREAVKYSPADTTITFAPALSGQTIRLTLGEILIGQSLTIDGSALPAKITISGDKTGDGRTADDRMIFRIVDGALIFDSLNLVGGYAPNNFDGKGGAIYSSFDTAKVTVRNSIFSGNSSILEGGAIYFSGRLNSPESFLRVEKSTFTGNSATFLGGAIHCNGTLILDASTFSTNTALGADGGAIYVRNGNAQISKSYFFGNTATWGGAISNSGILVLESSTLAGNSAFYGGGIHDSTVNGESVTIENSTFTANYASQYGGAISFEGSGGPYLMRHSTVTGNTALSNGGGIEARRTVFADRCIVSINTAPRDPDVTSGQLFSISKNLLSGDPRLAPLGNYGGPTQTMPPLPGSPAIDAGTTTLTTDQRGFPRLSTADIGAAEYQGTSDLTRFWPLDFDGDASPYGTEQALGTDPLVSDPASSRNITAPVLNASGHPVLRFGIGAAAPGTRWILCRSTDLLTFTEIYRYNGTSDTAALGVTFLRTATGVTVTDTTPPPGGVFYRFEAQFGN